MELLEEMPFLEWMANNYKNFGANLEIITDRSQEGSQFVKGTSMSFYPDFILILSKFYPDKIRIEFGYRGEYNVENLKLIWRHHKNCKTHPKGKKKDLFIFQ